ncbi:MAG: hypothetical protein WDM91_15860 [Rhizomicrobium sp.]
MVAKTKKKAPKKAAKKAKKAAKRSVKAATRKTPAKTAKKAKKAAKRSAPRKAAAKKTVAKTAKRPAKTAAKRKAGRGEFGEGNYKASKRFRESQETFVKSHRGQIAALGKAAEDALDGPEGKDLAAAEAEAASHAAGGDEE